MPIEYIFAIVPFVFINTIALTIYLSRLSTRISYIENELLLLKKDNLLNSSKFDTLHKVEAQLELLIAHLFPQK